MANLAARLCAQAKLGQILGHVVVGTRAGGVARSAPVGDLALKRFDRPVPAFNVAALS